MSSSSVCLLALFLRGPGLISSAEFAEALQHLEGEFYNQTLSKFQDSDITAAGFSTPQLLVEQLSSIAKDESTHAAVLDVRFFLRLCYVQILIIRVYSQAVLGQLGASPITGCSFDFSSVLTSVDSVAATARLVENVGVGAYLGAAQLLTNPSVLSAAGVILTVEARHQTVLNMLSSTGSVIPSAFDLALLPTEVLAIAGGFVSGCDLGVGAPNPSLAVTSSGALQPGAMLQFNSTALNGTLDPSKLSCSMLVGGASFSIVQDLNSCMVPPGINGPVLVYVTADNNPLAGNPAVRAQNKIVAGPAMVFVDTAPQAIPQLLRGSGSALSGSVSSGSSSSDSSSASSSDSSSDSATATGSSDASSQTASATDSSSDASATASATDGSSDASSASSSDASASTSS
jgi:hypothetical protein